MQFAMIALASTIGWGYVPLWLLFSCLCASEFEGPRDDVMRVIVAVFWLLVTAGYAYALCTGL